METKIIIAIVLAGIVSASTTMLLNLAPVVAFLWGVLLGGSFVHVALWLDWNS